MESACKLLAPVAGVSENSHHEGRSLHRDGPAASDGPHWQFLHPRRRNGSSGGPARIGEPPDLSRRHDVVIMIFVPKELIFANEHARADVRLWTLWGLERTILLC